MQLSISIVNYKVEDELMQCLQSLQDCLPNIEHEIIVSDNHFLEGVQERVLEKFPNVNWIQNKENLGFGKAHNQSLQKAKGKFIAIINPDVTVRKDTFLKLFSLYDTLENPGILGVRMYNEIDEFLPESKRNIPKLWNSLLKFVPLPIAANKPYYAEHIKEDETHEVEILSGAFMFLEKNVFDTIGGFDERYFLYAEDIDISMESLKKGYKNYYLGEIEITHTKGKSMGKNKESRKHFYYTMKQFIDKHYSNPIERVFMISMVQLQKWRESVTKKSDT